MESAPTASGTHKCVPYMRCADVLRPADDRGRPNLQRRLTCNDTRRVARIMVGRDDLGTPYRGAM